MTDATIHKIAESGETEDLFSFTESGELTQHLNPFQAVACLCGYLKDNGLTTKLDLSQVIAENRRDTPHRVGNIKKWGLLQYEKLTNGRIRYSSLELLAWAARNKHHFDKVAE